MYICICNIVIFLFSSPCQTWWWPYRKGPKHVVYLLTPYTVIKCCVLTHPPDTLISYSLDARFEIRPDHSTLLTDVSRGIPGFFQADTRIEPRLYHDRFLPHSSSLSRPTFHRWRDLCYRQYREVNSRNFKYCIYNPLKPEMNLNYF